MRTKPVGLDGSFRSQQSFPVYNGLHVAGFRQIILFVISDLTLSSIIGLLTSLRTYRSIYTISGILF